MSLDKANQDFSAAYAAYDKVLLAFRAREVGYEEYAAARRDFEQAKKDWDVAESAYVAELEAKANVPAIVEASPQLSLLESA